MNESVLFKRTKIYGELICVQNTEGERLLQETQCILAYIQVELDRAVSTPFLDGWGTSANPRRAPRPP